MLGLAVKVGRVFNRLEAPVRLEDFLTELALMRLDEGFTELGLLLLMLLDFVNRAGFTVDWIFAGFETVDLEEALDGLPELLLGLEEDGDWERSDRVWASTARSHRKQARAMMMNATVFLLMMSPPVIRGRLQLLVKNNELRGPRGIPWSAQL